MFNIFDLFRTKKEKMDYNSPLVYYTDDYERAKELMGKQEVSVEYHAVRTKINPAHCYVLDNGHKIWQYNSEYVGYLKKLIPNIETKEAYAYIDYLLQQQDDKKSIRNDVAFETIANIDEIVKKDESKRTSYGHYGDSPEKYMSKSEGKKLVRCNKNKKDDLF